MKRLLFTTACSALAALLIVAPIALSQSVTPGPGSSGTGSGTVTSVATGGLVTGGPITSSGTVALSNIGAGDVVANAAGSSAAPADTTLTALIDQALGNTRGAVLERGASGWTVLAPSSTAGQALASNGTGADPTYQTVTGGSGASLSAANTWTTAGAVSAPTQLFTGAIFTGGSGTTNVPFIYYNAGATPPASWSAQGGFMGFNFPSGFTGNVFQGFINGASEWSISATGGAFFTTTTTALNVVNGVPFISKTAPSSVGACFAASGSAITFSSGTGAFGLTVGTTPSTSCTLTLPSSGIHDWTCRFDDRTTGTVLIHQSGAANTGTVTLTASAAPTTGDYITGGCGGF